MRKTLEISWDIVYTSSLYEVNLNPIGLLTAHSVSESLQIPTEALLSFAE